MNTFIIIPAFNAEKTVKQVIESTKKFGEVILIDDKSTDSTLKEALSTQTIVLRHCINKGQGAALQTGIDYALSQNADIIVNMDSDMQHDPNQIPELIKPIIDREVDVVLGSRFLDKQTNMTMPKSRLLILKLATIFTKIISNINVTDTHNGFRAFSRDAASKIKITQDRMAHASEILDEIVKKKLKYIEIPVNIIYTTDSLNNGQKSSGSIKIVFDIIKSKIFN